MRSTFTSMAVAAIVAAAPAAFAQDKVLFKTPTTFNTELPGLGTPLPRVAEAIDVLSDGNMKMRVYEPGELVAPFEILDAVSTGKINSGWATAGYWAGKIPASPLFSAVPFGPEAGEYMAWLYYGNGMDLYQEMYDQAGYNVHVLPCSISASGDLRLVRQGDQHARGPPGPQDAVLRPRRHRDAEARRRDVASARRRDLPGARAGRDRRVRVRDAGGRHAPRLPQDRQIQLLPRLASAGDRVRAADQRRRLGRHGRAPAG